MAGVGGRFGTATASALRSTAIRFLPRRGSRDYENPYPCVVGVETVRGGVATSSLGGRRRNWWRQLLVEGS
uniref:Uncharacterized protein n=1 Tax=Oryza nivara TaxID=4536 RepID=A0A0E0GRJ1_ORYNI